MTIKTLCSDMLLLAVFMLMGFFIREYIKPLQKLFLPASLIGGLLILLLGQQVLGVVTVPDSYSGIPNVQVFLVRKSIGKSRNLVGADSSCISELDDRNA